VRDGVVADPLLDLEVRVAMLAVLGLAARIVGQLGLGAKDASVAAPRARI
jgi:hypothetical protein